FVDTSDMSIPTGEAAAAVDRARNEQEAEPAEGPAAAAVAAARDESRQWTPTAPAAPAQGAQDALAEFDVPSAAADAVQRARGMEGKALTTERPALEYEPSPSLTEANALA